MKNGTMCLKKVITRWKRVVSLTFCIINFIEELPPICFVTKNYIQNIESKEWPSLDPKELLIEGNF